MKWFKSNRAFSVSSLEHIARTLADSQLLAFSDVLKFQHLSQLLLDMNCPLIMVKTFLLQDPVDLVQAKNEAEDRK